MKRSDTREHIIKTASNLFYQKGYNATGINEIIKEANIAKATLYNHFRSKDDICLAYLRHRNDSFITEISSYCEGQKKGSNQVLAIYDFLMTFYNDPEFNGCWCVKTVAEVPKSNEKIRLEIKRQKDGLLQFIQKLIDHNTDHKDEKERKVLARQAYLLYEGAVTESHLHQEDWPIKEAKSVCNRLLN